MIKRILFIVLTVSFTTTATVAQKLEVKGLSLEANDPAATQFAVKDYNGDNCALIIVGLAVDDAEFEGNIIRSERKPNGEYWVYITNGSEEFQINTKDFLPEPVDFVKLGITKVEGGRTYRMNVEHPNLAQSFDELCSIAKNYYAEYPSHTESSFYDAAKIAYDNAIKHNDCPFNLRDSLRAEYDLMADLRRNTYLVEAAEKKAKEFEREKGFDSDEVFKYLGGEIGFIDRILKAHPEMAVFNSLRSDVAQKLGRHPKSKIKDGEEVIMRKRETISGTVSFKNEYMAIPFERMKIYATSSSEIKNGQSRMIGKVNADGTFNVVKPDGINPLYIYVSGEKDDAHYVSAGTTSIDIIVK